MLVWIERATEVDKSSVSAALGEVSDIFLRWLRMETDYAHTVTAAAKMTLAGVLIRHDVDCITVENTQLVSRHVVPARACSSAAPTVCCGKAHNLGFFQGVWNKLSSNECHYPRGEPQVMYDLLVKN